MKGQVDAALPGDERFFERNGPFSLQKLAECAGAQIVGDDGVDSDRLYVGIAPLQSAGPQDVSFLDNRRYAPLLEQTRAGVVLLGQAFVDRLPKNTVGLVCQAPYLAWARVASLFHPAPAVVPGIHPTALLGTEAVVDPSAQIGPFVVIGARASIGAETRIDSHAVIGEGVRIGERCRVGAHTCVSHAFLGDRVTLLAGVRIGQEGFGFAVGPDGFETVPQLGRVILEDGVEVGANSTIDRGSSQDTIIGAGSRLDNLVQIGHNARLGRCCIVVSQAGISGSTELGDFVTVAAQAGLIGHIRIGTKARIGAQCGVMSDVEAGADVIGSPAMPFREFFRNVAVLRRLAKKTPRDGGGEA